MSEKKEAIALFSLDKFTEGSTAWLYWAEWDGNIEQGEAPTLDEAEAKAFAYLGQFEGIPNIHTAYKPGKPVAPAVGSFKDAFVEEDYDYEVDEDTITSGYVDVDEWKQA